MPAEGGFALVLIVLRRGVIAGLVAGLIVGELNHLIGGYVVHPVQLLLDYPVAYASVGLVGIARHFGWKTKQVGMT